MEQVCRALEVSRSGYYGWLKHKPGMREQRNLALKRKLVELHEKYPAMGGQPLPSAEARLRLLAQAGVPADAAGRDFLSQTPELQNHNQFQPRAPHRAEPAAA